MDLKGKFLKIYANLPLGLRKETILVFEKEPVTWNAAYMEVQNDTDKSKRMLKRFEELGLI
jgi:hypothetical protein